MRFVSPFLKTVVYPSLSAAGFFRRLASDGLAVVTYYGVLPADYELVDDGLDRNLLKENYSVICPEVFRGWLQGRCELLRRAAVLTCDDGLLNNLTEMLPIVQQEGLECLFFVTGASCGDSRRSLWYEELFLVFAKEAAGPFSISSDGVLIEDPRAFLTSCLRCAISCPRFLS